MTVLITLTTAGADTGPFDLYSNLDGYVSAFETGVSKSSLLAGYSSALVPDGTSVIRIKSNGNCVNYIDVNVVILTTTTTSTSSSTTTTTTTTTAVVPSITNVSYSIEQINQEDCQVAVTITLTSNVSVDTTFDFQYELSTTGSTTYFGSVTVLAGTNTATVYVGSASPSLCEASVVSPCINTVTGDPVPLGVYGCVAP